jgi:cyclopropane-fatty-acyl-phospholipid synthase
MSSTRHAGQSDPTREAGQQEHQAVAVRATAAEGIKPLLHAVVGTDVPVRFELWDGSAIGPIDAAGVVRINSPNAVRRIMWSPDQLGLGRAYVAGELDIEGDLYRVLEALRDAVRPNLQFDTKAVLAAFDSARRLRALGGPPSPPPEEASPSRGPRHSKERDARVVRHHYDVGNDFYRIVLGPAMTYSCARFSEPDVSLADAQAAKHDLICRKLGLHERPGKRLLDVGCGWGSLAIHAATNYDVEVVGVTISQPQVELARQRVAGAGLSARVDIRLQDYRDVQDETFDAIASVGMFEHVGAKRMTLYFERLHQLLAPTGRLLNHAISSVNGSAVSGRSFIGRYVFPDGELIDVSAVQRAMQHAGFEIRDVEALREHYARTLRHWGANLEAAWDRAVSLVGAARARIWRLYMAGSAIGFEDGGINVHQVLGVKTAPDGVAAMPLTRRDWN